MKGLMWIDIYGLAKKYYEEHGDLLIPQKYEVEIEKEDGSIEKIRLGAWIMSQRQRYNGTCNSKLSNEQIELLEKIGMVWKVCVGGNISTSWKEKYEVAKKYYEEHGNLLVPQNYIVEIEKDDGIVEKVKLGYWIMNQRQRYNGTCNSKLSNEQIELLEKIGIVWKICVDDTILKSWEEKYEVAKKYYEEHGNLLVRQDYIIEIEKEDGTEQKVQLGQWINRQRQKYNGMISSKLSNEQIKLLEEIGMVWDDISNSWEEKYELAKKYYGEHGDLLVPRNYIVEIEKEKGRIEKVQLGYWIITQRQKYNGTINGELLDEQIESLEKIGMIWNIHMYKLVNKEITRKTKKKILLKLEKILLEKILIKNVKLDNNEKEKINKKMLLYLDRY